MEPTVDEVYQEELLGSFQIEPTLVLDFLVSDMMVQQFLMNEVESLQRKKWHGLL